MESVRIARQDYLHLQTRFHEDLPMNRDNESDNESDNQSEEACDSNKITDDDYINLTWRSWVVVLVTCFAQLAQVFITVAAGQMIPFVARDIGDAALSGWIIQGLLLMQAVLSPIIGRLSDVFDRKWLMSIPPLIACAGAAVAATAKTMPVLIGGVVLIGVNLSTIAIVSAIPSEVLPLKYRAVANGAGFIGSALGGLAAGLGTGAVINMSIGGWRNVFWIEAALQGITTIGLVLFYHPPRRPDFSPSSFKQSMWAVDPIGSVLFMAGATLVLLAFDWLGGSYVASNIHFWLPLTIGLVCLVLFAFYEWKGRSDGLVAHAFFGKSPNFALGVFILVIEGWIFYSAVLEVLPQLILNLGFAHNAWELSLRQLAAHIPTIFACLVFTWWATAFKNMKTPLLVGFTLFLAASLCYAMITPEMNTAQLGFTVLVSVGQSGPLILLLALVQFSAPHEHLSTATGLALSARALGGAFGSAVLNAIISGKLSKTYTSEVGDAAVEAGLPQTSLPQLLTALQSGDIQSLGNLPGSNETVIAAAVDASHWAYAQAYRLAFWSIVPFIVLAMVAAGSMKGVRELMTERIEATVEPKVASRVDVEK